MRFIARNTPFGGARFYRECEGWRREAGLSRDEAARILRRYGVQVAAAAVDRGDWFDFDELTTIAKYRHKG